MTAEQHFIEWITSNLNFEWKNVINRTRRTRKTFRKKWKKPKFSNINWWQNLDRVDRFEENNCFDKNELKIIYNFIVSGGAAIGLSIICAPFVAPALRKYCLPYVPATNSQLDNILQLIKNNRNHRLLDIGSGDGRIVIGELMIAMLLLWFIFNFQY